MSLISYELIDHIACIKLVRSEKRNAISLDMLTELAEKVKIAETEARAGVIYGDGDHFCAGLDLSEHVEKTTFESIENSRTWHRIFNTIKRGKIPYFSALHGAVVGGGLELAAATHVRVADETAFFALPEGKHGIFVGGGGSVNISDIMGTARMMDMMLTGHVLSAQEAEKYAIITYLTPKKEAFSKAFELATSAATNAQLANYAIINALPRIHKSGYDEGLFFESMMATLTDTTPEAKTRLKAFLDKKAARLEIPQ